MSKATGWAAYEMIGYPIIFPITHVYNAIQKNKETTNSSNIDKLIKICFMYVPHNRKPRVLDILADEFPELINEIDKYRILI